MIMYFDIFFNINQFQFKIVNSSVKRVEKIYDCCPDVYPHLAVELEIQKLKKVKQSDGSWKYVDY